MHEYQAVLIRDCSCYSWQKKNSSTFLYSIESYSASINLGHECTNTRLFLFVTVRVIRGRKKIVRLFYTLLKAIQNSKTVFRQEKKFFRKKLFCSLLDHLC